MDGMTGIQPTYNLAEHNNGYCGDGFGFGGSGIWLFAILALMWGGNGMWGNRGGFGFPNDCAKKDDVYYTSAFNQLQNENMGLASEIQRVGYENMAVTKDASYNNLSELRDIQAQLGAGFANAERCCCDTLRAIDSVNYNGAINTASLEKTILLDGQKTRDLIQTNKIEALQSKVSQLELQSAMCGVVRYPLQTTYNAGNPFFNGCGCGYGYNNGNI